MNTAKPKILCVDDELVNLKLFEAALASEGYEVIKATNQIRNRRSGGLKPGRMIFRQSLLIEQNF